MCQPQKKAKAGDALPRKTPWIGRGNGLTVSESNSGVDIVTSHSRIEPRQGNEAPRLSTMRLPENLHPTDAPCPRAQARMRETPTPSPESRLARSPLAVVQYGRVIHTTRGARGAASIGAIERNVCQVSRGGYASTMFDL